MKFYTEKLIFSQYRNTRDLREANEAKGCVFKRMKGITKPPFLLANLDRIAISSPLVDDESEENNDVVQGSQAQSVSREGLQAMDCRP